MRKTSKMRRLVLSNGKSNHIFYYLYYILYLYFIYVYFIYYIYFLLSYYFSTKKGKESNRSARWWGQCCEKTPLQGDMLKPQKRMVGAAESAGLAIRDQQENTSTLRTQQGHQRKWVTPALGGPASKKRGKHLNSYWLMKVKDKMQTRERHRCELRILKQSPSRQHAEMVFTATKTGPELPSNHEAGERSLLLPRKLQRARHHRTCEA